MHTPVTLQLWITRVKVEMNHYEFKRRTQGSLGARVPRQKIKLRLYSLFSQTTFRLQWLIWAHRKLVSPFHPICLMRNKIKDRKHFWFILSQCVVQFLAVLPLALSLHVLPVPVWVLHLLLMHSKLIGDSKTGLVVNVNVWCCSSSDLSMLSAGIGSSPPATLHR